MCLIVSKDKKPPDSIVYAFKVLREDLMSLHYPMQYQMGVNKATGDLYTEWNPYGISMINGGAIHLYLDWSYAHRLVYRHNQYRPDRLKHVFAEFRCYPDHFVSWGKADEVCYTQVEMINVMRIK